MTQRQNRNTAGNTGLAKVAAQCSADTFVVNKSLVFRINICGENRHLRQARKRYTFLKNFNFPSHILWPTSSTGQKKPGRFRHVPVNNGRLRSEGSRKSFIRVAFLCPVP